MRRLLNPWCCAGLLILAGLSVRCAMAQSGDGLDQSAGACRAAQLRNGYTIPYERQETDGKTIRLYMCANSGNGYVELPVEQIANLDHLESSIPHVSTSVGGKESTFEAQSAPTLVTGQAATLVTAQAATAIPTMESIGALIATAAERYSLDPDFVASVVKAESGFNPKAVSPKGALGLMQLMPGTAAQFAVDNVFDPAANVDGGTRYLRQLLDKYAGNALKALAAYNAGPGRVQQYNGVPPFRETRAYVARIIDDFNRKKIQQQTLQALARPVPE